MQVGEWGRRVGARFPNRGTIGDPQRPLPGLGSASEPGSFLNPLLRSKAGAAMVRLSKRRDDEDNLSAEMHHNAPLHRLRISDPEELRKSKKLANYVSTTKYTMLTFLPKALYEQVRQSCVHWRAAVDSSCRRGVPWWKTSLRDLHRWEKTLFSVPPSTR